MKRALIYFEGKPLMNVEYDKIEVKENGHYLFLDEKSIAFVPFNHLIITKEEPVVKVTFNPADLDCNSPSYWGGSAGSATTGTTGKIFKTY
jgi:hypothetical protein